MEPPAQVMREAAAAPDMPATQLLDQQPQDVVDRIMAAHPVVLDQSFLSKKLSVLPQRAHAAAPRAALVAQRGASIAAMTRTPSMTAASSPPC
jgi:hypothetical protein